MWHYVHGGMQSTSALQSRDRRVYKPDTRAARVRVRVSLCFFFYLQRVAGVVHLPYAL